MLNFLYGNKSVKVLQKGVFQRLKILGSNLRIKFKTYAHDNMKLNIKGHPTFQKTHCHSESVM